MATPLEESLQKLNQQAQGTLLQSGYHRSLVRFHEEQANEFDKQVDQIAKKIRNLEANTPKPAPASALEEVKTNDIAEETK